MFKAISIFVFFLIAACSSKQSAVEQVALNENQKVSESLTRIKSVNDSTNDMFDEVAKKTKVAQ